MSKNNQVTVQVRIAGRQGIFMSYKFVCDRDEILREHDWCTRIWDDCSVYFKWDDSFIITPPHNQATDELKNTQIN